MLQNNTSQHPKIGLSTLATMSEERLIVELQLALLSAIAHRRGTLTYNIIDKMLTKAMNLDDYIREKIYALEIRPRLLKLLDYGLIDEIYDGHRDRWRTRV